MKIAGEGQLPSEGVSGDGQRIFFTKKGPDNKYARLIQDQTYAVFEKPYVLESGREIAPAQVAFKYWGSLNDTKDNCIVICHAMTGSADAADWWGPLFGQGQPFDPSVYFIICFNILGSPYGSTSPITINAETGKIYGPEFPLATMRDDANIQRAVTEALGVKSVALVIGGSMGGMVTLEWAFFKDYVRTVVVMASAAYHSAWSIAWAEMQRQSIYTDSAYNDGYYDIDHQPERGLAAARMAAMLTYRTRFSFDRKFGRKTLDAWANISPQLHDIAEQNPRIESWLHHNDGNYRKTLANMPRPREGTLEQHGLNRIADNPSQNPFNEPREASAQHSNSATVHRPFDTKRAPTYFSVQSYLRYQGRKFVNRFDANCYLAIARKLDSHDISRGRFDTVGEALQSIKQKTLILGIESDVLFTFNEQAEMNRFIPHSRFNVIVSTEGHDGFLLEVAQLTGFLSRFQRWALPEYYLDQQTADMEDESEIEADDAEFTTARTRTLRTRQRTAFREECDFMN